MDNITLDMAAKLISQDHPEIWRYFNTRHFDVPGNYCGFKLPAVAMSSVAIEMVDRPKDFLMISMAVASEVLRHYNFPTYYVSKDLMSALQRTRAPDMPWSDLHLPFDGMIFMLPINFLKEEVTNEPINMVGVAKLKKGVPLQIPLLNRSLGARLDYDKIVVFWTSGASGTTVAQVAFNSTQPLSPSSAYLDSADFNIENRNFLDLVEAGLAPGSKFSSYMCGLVSNFILTMLARPEMVEHGGATDRVLKNGLRVHRPTFIGRKYEVLRKAGPRNPTGAKFTELMWKAGAFRRQHYGHGNVDLKTIWVEPYMCYGNKLVRGVEAQSSTTTKTIEV